MLHPLITTFVGAIEHRFADLTVEQHGDEVLCKWQETRHTATYEVGVRVLNGALVFDYDGGTLEAKDADPLATLIKALSRALYNHTPDDDDDSLALPGRLSALVWPQRHRLRLAVINEEARSLEAAIARLEPAAMPSVNSPDRLS